MPRHVFFITGTSTGLGKEYVTEVLTAGDIAVATARDPSKLSFRGATFENFLAIALDVTDKPTIDKAFKVAIDRFGRIDVVVNNAGYGVCGVFESFSEEQVCQQMELNFFWLLNVTRRSMELMRELKTGGLNQQITSIGGHIGAPCFSMYCASKRAVEGFTEAISRKVKPEWGIKFTCVEPGGFRTDSVFRAINRLWSCPDHRNWDAKKTAEKSDMKEPGDPGRGAKALYELAVMKNPPLRCVLGTDAYLTMNEKLDIYRENVKKFEALSISTDVDVSERQHSYLIDEAKVI